MNSETVKGLFDLSYLYLASVVARGDPLFKPNHAKNGLSVWSFAGSHVCMGFNSETIS